ncbi:MAG: hypothetical protein AABY00_03390 [Nanoarchaeota archaeon]
MKLLFQMRIVSACIVIFLVLISLSFVNAGTSCDVAVGVAYVLKSDFTDQQSTARVLVHGEAQGSFSETTSVYVDCNVNGVEPRPLEKTVKARLTLSSSTLAYSTNCYYPKPEKDTQYSVSAKVDGTECTRSVDLGSVTTPGFGMPSGNLTQPICGKAGEKECTSGDRCKSGFVPDGYGKCTTCPAGTTLSNGKCVGTESKKEIPGEKRDTSGLVCLDGSKPMNGACPDRKKGCPEGSIEDTFTGQCYEDPYNNRPVVCVDGQIIVNGKCVKKVGDENIDLPQLPEDEETFTITLRNKYTFIGIPFEDGKVISSTCTNSVAYAHDQQKNSFVIMDSTDILSYVGKGILAKIPSGTECKIVFSGSFSDEQSFDLKKGWNLISPQTRAYENEKNRKSDCTFTSPFVGLDGKYYKSKVMKPGAGYLVKVKEACTLSTKDALDLPRLPSEEGEKSITQGIEPQRGKSRRFSGDAG